MSFVKRQINVKIQKTVGGTFSSGANTVDLKGLRISLTIKSASTPFSTASIRIWGLTQSLITDLATFGFLRTGMLRNDIITVTAGDVGMQPKQVFYGTITTAEPDFQGAPAVPLNIEAQVGAFQLVDRTGSQTINGPTSAATLMQKLANQGNMSFENNNVNVNLPTMALWGSLGQQIRQVADAGKFTYFIDETNTLAIWPKGQARNKQGPVMVAPPPDGNMIGYPTFGNPLLHVKNLFDSSVKLGTQIQVKSSLKPANGIWNVVEIIHELEAEMPGGKWHSTYGVWSSTVASPTPAAAT